MIKLVIIADDLTGSLDTGVQFTKKNIPTLVITDLNFDIKSIPEYIEAIVIDTESRHIDKEEAKERVKSVIAKFDKNSVKHFYKKIDSTFRGNVGKELEGLMEGLGTKELYFVPAFPDSGRIIKKGILYVNGTKITDTQFAKDILNPITDDYIPNILKQSTDMKVLTYNEKKSGITDSAIYLFDSESKADMLEIGKELFEKNLLFCTAGSAGFAEVLADYVKNDINSTDIKISDSRILFICGSVNVTSLNQCKYAEKNNFPSTALNFYNLISEDCSKLSNYEIVKEELNNKVLENQHLLIKTSAKDEVIKDAIEYAKNNNLKIENLTENIANNVGRITKDLIVENNLQNLIVFGGDTLIGILKNLECSSVIPLKEISSGVVFTKALCKDREINIITKAGGFGKENVIDEIKEFINKIKV